MATFPNAIATFTTKADGAGNKIFAAHINGLQDEITALETDLLNGFAHDLKFTDATYDIGKTGATRPRDLFLSRNATIGGTLGVVGVTTISSTATRGLIVSAASAIAGIQIASAGGSGKTYGIVSDTTGALSIQDDADANPQINFSAAGVATISATSGISLSGGVTHTANVADIGIVSPPQIVATQNNYNPTGLSAARILRITTDVSRTITGLTAQANGTRILLQNCGVQDLVFTNEDGGSVAANRWQTPGGVSFTLNTGDGVEVWYDVISARWRMAGF